MTVRGIVLPITKTLTTTACIGQRLNAMNELEDFTEVLFQPVKDVKQASRILRRRCKDDSILITKLESETHTYRMPLDKFVANAEIVEDGE